MIGLQVRVGCPYPDNADPDPPVPGRRRRASNNAGRASDRSSRTGTRDRLACEGVHRSECDPRVGRQRRRRYAGAANRPSGSTRRYAVDRRGDERGLAELVVASTRHLGFQNHPFGRFLRSARRYLRGIGEGARGGGLAPHIPAALRAELAAPSPNSHVAGERRARVEPCNPLPRTS